jgi:predicted nuclease with TOPRIM domain
MNIDENILRQEKETLQKDFNSLSNNIKKVEKDLETMKGNLNAVWGAIQEVDRLTKKLNEGENTMPIEKERALNIATS